MSKSTPLSVQNAFNEKLKSSQDQAAAIKAAHKAARQEIINDTRRSDVAKSDDLRALQQETAAKIAALKESQESFIRDLRDKVEREFRGSQPTDPGSVVSRRDAADRARKLSDKREALEVLQDAIAGNDADLAHAVGVRARNNGWVDAAAVYTSAFPDTAGSAEALDYIDSNGPGTPAYNMLSSMTFSAPTE